MPFLMPPSPSPAAKNASESGKPELSSFPLFSLLATELRLKIWALAFEPRVVSIRYLPSEERCASSTSLPTLLAVNREAREETLRRYKLLFSTPKSSSRIYFNPDLDTIYLPRYRDMGYDETLRDFRCYLRSPEELNAIQWLALDHVESDIKRPWESYDKAVLIKSFVNLRSIYLVLRSGKRGESPVRTEKKVEFVVPQGPPEEILKIWANFRNAFSREEDLMVEVFHSSGLAYEPRMLPAVTVVAKRG